MDTQQNLRRANRGSALICVGLILPALWAVVGSGLSHSESMMLTGLRRALEVGLLLLMIGISLLYRSIRADAQCRRWVYVAPMSIGILAGIVALAIRLAVLS